LTAASNPAKLEEMKALFLVESAKYKNLPIGGGLWVHSFVFIRKMHLFSVD